MYDSGSLVQRPSKHDLPTTEYFHHSSAPRVSTDAVIVGAIKAQYPNLHLTITPEASCNLLRYASAGHALVTPVDDAGGSELTSLKWRQYIPPAKRLDKEAGVLADHILFGKYIYVWNDYEYILYVVDGRDGSSYYPRVRNCFILSKSEDATNGLIIAASRFHAELHNEVWVFDGGMWQKSSELWKSVQKASWDDVILDADMKKTIITDVQKFFDSRETYTKLKVPWKRGVIYHGPPGNGKTISIKAMMHALYERQDPVPTLYVRSLTSFGGPEYALSEIFTKARQSAPCYLVFEDLDSIVTDSVRSYFLNEVDGLQSNDGILMVGSTNHLDRLDPGISKRPSRFDRKFFFPDPNHDERVKYCEFWQHKLADNKDIDFPDKLCAAIAKITDGFSFAYMQEAFIAALLAIAAYNDQPDPECWNPSKQILMWQSAAQNYVRNDATDDEDGSLDSLFLWREIKKQIKLLREEMDRDESKKAFFSCREDLDVVHGERLLLKLRGEKDVMRSGRDERDH
ncbi:MAG: hypothetical protein M1834_001221 [Cirrosporium novae-zelandiae]|nr:MAG: hypothetical protein M1834_001221 [Cirrosporium novae-zelandiae]